MHDGNDEEKLTIPIMHHYFFQSSFEGLGTSQVQHEVHFHSRKFSAESGNFTCISSYH
jgi:hypothetical protein